MLRRSLQWLVAEEIQKAGIMTDINDAIRHMSNSRNYGVCNEEPLMNERDAYIVVTVSFHSEAAAVFRINQITEEISMWAKVGKW